MEWNSIVKKFFHCNLYAWKLERMKCWKVKAFKLHKMKLKWSFASFNYNWDVAKFGNASVNLQRIWNEIAFEIHWKLHREKVFDSNEKGFALAKRYEGRGGWVRRGGWVSQKELTSCNFPSNFRNYSLSQMPSDGKLIASKFRFRISVGLVLTKYFLCVISIHY